MPSIPAARDTMTPFTREFGTDDPPVAWDGDMAQPRAELDAWYARACGLTRDELRYILDPAQVKARTTPPKPSASSRRTTSPATATTAPPASSSRRGMRWSAIEAKPRGGETA